MLISFLLYVFIIIDQIADQYVILDPILIDSLNLKMSIHIIGVRYGNMIVKVM